MEKLDVQEPHDSAPRPALTGWKANLVVLLLGLLPFVLLEASLWLIGYKSHAYYENTAPRIQVFRAAGSQMEVTPERRTQFRTRPFAAVKPQGSLRIVAVGDSVTAGFARNANNTGYGFIDRSYPEILQSLLASNYPGRAIEVVNCGGSGYGSYRLKDVTAEVLRYSPDLVTIMLGSSEFLEARHFKNWEGVRAYASRGVLHWRTLSLARDLLRRALAFRTAGKRRDLILDANAPSLPWMVQDLVKGADEIRAVMDHSALNIAGMVRACKAAGVRVILCTSPSNLRMMTSQSCSPGEDSDFARLIRKAQELVQNRNYAEAIRILAPELEKYQGDYSCGVDIYFLAAEAYDKTGDMARAYDCYMKAKDLDPAVLRTQSAFNDMIRRIAREEGVPLVDIEAACRRAVPDGIPDDRLFLDNCHFRPEGHEFVAHVLLEPVRAQLFAER